MYNNQQIAARIKSHAKMERIALKDMLADLGLGVNLISQLAHGSNITAMNLSRIAEYLNCSVDYLLGLTDDPLGGRTCTEPSAAAQAGSRAAEFITLFSQLTPEQQSFILSQLRGILSDQ